MNTASTLETATNLSSLLPAIEAARNEEALFTEDLDAYGTESEFESESEEGLESWVLRLDTAIRHIENLMLQMRLMEADRALFLTVEHFGWHRALSHLQMRLDHLHHRSKEQRLRRLLIEAEADRSAECLEPALEKLEKALTLLASDHRDRPAIVEKIGELRHALAERQKVRIEETSASDIWGTLAENRGQDRRFEIEEISRLIASGEWNQAAAQLEAAVDHWGLSPDLNELYQQIVVGQAEARTAGQRDAQNRIADLFLQATLAVETGDWFKARLLVADLLAREPEHVGGAELARQLDQI